MKYILYIIFAFFILFYSCEKKEQPQKPSKTDPVHEIQTKIASVIEKTTPSLVTVISHLNKTESIILSSGENESVGSGFIINKNKQFLYIVTNSHVLEKSNDVDVKFFNGVKEKADVVGYDTKSDIAVLKVKIDEKVKNVYPVKIGDLSKIKAGYFVLSAGSPYNLGHTYTFGIISSLHRNLGLSAYEDYIQTDAAINPGNSGGPLFDIDGNVIGMNIAIIDAGQGIGFALPINTVLEIYNEILKYGKVRRGWLGVLVQPLEEKIYKELNIKNGVIVVKVFKDSPAEKAGMEVGDIILEINNQPVTSPQDLSFKIQKLKPGEEINVKLLRGKNIKNIKVLIEDSDMIK
jgi:serine protease Do